MPIVKKLAVIALESMFTAGQFASSPVGTLAGKEYRVTGQTALTKARSRWMPAKMAQPDSITTIASR